MEREERGGRERENIIFEELRIGHAGCSSAVLSVFLLSYNITFVIHLFV